MDMMTGDIVTNKYTEYHLFAHISPRLTMILRLNLLPLAAEDAEEETRLIRETLHHMVQMQHHDPETATSFLADLPVTKPRNSYNKIVDESPISITGKEPILSPNDMFYFRFFPLSCEHVGKINMIFLEEAYNTSIIAFKSKTGLLRALEFYLDFEDEDQMRSFKKVGRAEDDEKRIYLRKLEDTVKLLGGSVTAKIKEVEDEIVRVDMNKLVIHPDQVQEMIQDDEDMMRIYTRLCKVTILCVLTKLTTEYLQVESQNLIPTTSNKLVYCSHYASKSTHGRMDLMRASERKSDRISKTCIVN